MGSRYAFAKSKSGETVPLIITGTGEKKPLHSMIDPKREAQRLVSAETSDSNFFVLFGLGGGFTAEAVLNQTRARLIVIDFDNDSINELFSEIDFSALVNNKRFSLLIDPEKEEIENLILQNYNPSLYGGIKVIPLRARTEADISLFDNAAKAVQLAIEIVSSDYSVQVHFGKRWFSNIIRNIKDFNPPDIRLPSSVETAAIIAAGPSLNQQLSALKELNQVLIICCDTALPVLLQNGIKPDITVSIDCQHISFSHFTGCQNTKDILLALDIASPPLLSRLDFSPVFFSSSHPLARFFSAAWYPLPNLDTSGGNVTYACLSLAGILGAKNIILLGADFAYVKSKTYAKGTYINPFFEKRQNRFLPLEAQSSSFLYRTEFLPKTAEAQSYRETSSLRFYREKFEEKAAKMNAHIAAAAGEGAPVRLTGKLTHNTKSADVFFQKTEKTGAMFLEQYRKDIACLSASGWHDLNEKEREIFVTLLPAAAFLKHRNPFLNTNDLLEETKRFCIELIDKVL